MAKSIAIIGTRGYPSYYGGFETAVRKLAPYLADEGWDVTVYGRDGALRDDDSGRDPRIKSVITLGFEKKSLSTLSYGLTAVIHALLHRPDVALVMNVANGFWIPLLRLRGIPVVVNVDGIEWERAKWGRVAKAVFKMGAVLTAKFANTLVTDAREIQRRWQIGFNRGSVFIPYGGDDTPAQPAPLGLVRRGYVLVVARFVPENTINEFFDAAEALAEEYPVVIVGSSGYGGILDDRALELSKQPNVTWLGHVSDDTLLFSLWENAGVYFHGHSVGGTNPALVQAMACGAPTVARDTVYNREVLDGTGAVYVDADGTKIADAIGSMMSAHEQQESVAGAVRKRALDAYAWAKVCEEYNELVGSLLIGADSLVPGQAKS